MSNKAVHRLHSDIHRLNQAQKTRHDKAHEVNVDKRDLKSDQKHLARQRDAYQKNHKKYGNDKAKLDELKKTEQMLLQPLEVERQKIQAAYDASVDPATGQGDANLQNELALLDGIETQFKGEYDGKIAAQQQVVDGVRQAVTQNRTQIASDKKSIKHDRAELKHDDKALAHAKSRVKADRKKALKDLRPAEYHLGLKGTNKVRHELGLKSVHHVIRPGVKNVVGGQVGKWIAAAQTILKQHGIPLSKMNAHDIAIIIQHESGGNPKAVNNWDSNAAAGHPSEGLMQTIGPTFNSYKLPGHGHILNPVDNIIAGVRYAISRYGSISNVPGVRAVHSGGSYVGY